MKRTLATPRTLLLGLAFTLIVLLASTGVASAAKQRLETGVSFGPQGTGAGSFQILSAITVDQKSGDVFVYDTGGNGRIYKFNAAGEPVDFSGLGTNYIEEAGFGSRSDSQLAVDESSGPDAGDIYAANASNIRIFSAAGVPLGALEAPGVGICGVAVDSSGAVYAAEGGTKVAKFVPVSNPVTAAQQVSTLNGLESVCDIALDSSGNLYAAKSFGGVTRYEALQFGSPSLTGTLIDDSGVTLTVDRSTGNVLVNEQSDVAEYDSSGNLLGRSGEGALHEAFGVFGIALNDTNDELYMQNEGRVKLFGAPLLLPSISGMQSTEVEPTSATLVGHINPEGLATTYQFQYGTSQAYGSSVPISPESVGSDSSDHELTAHLTGLSPDIEYHYRLEATNSNGTAYSTDQTFTTTGPPIVSSGNLTSTGNNQSTAHVEGYIDPRGFDTHYEVEYGVTTAYGSSTEPVDVGTKAGSTEATMNDLATNTTYHYRFVASNSQGTTYGQDVTFTTSPIALLFSSLISEAGNTEVTLKSSVEAFGAPSTFYFEYGSTNEYGSSTKEEVLSGGASTIVTGLMPNTKYHFRVVVKNQYGTAYGEDVEFSTSPIPSLSLPDGRAYEKVSPTNNAKGNVIPQAPFGYGLASAEAAWTFQPFVASADGNAIAYMAEPSETGGTGHEGGGYGNQYLARRAGDAGWSATNIEPEIGNLSVTPGYQAFTKNLEDGIIIYNGQEPLVSGAPADEYPVLYRRDLSTMAFAPLFSVTPPHRTVEQFNAFRIPSIPDEVPGPAYVGGSADLSHMFFIANDALTANAIDGGRKQNNLYDSHGGELTLVNVLPNGETEPNAIVGAPVGELYFGNEPALTHAISEDGRRVYWTDLHNGNLYLRENDATTAQVDGSVGGGGVFWTATPDGSKALFIKEGDIYEYDATSGQATDLTPGGEVQGIVSTSEDLSYIYFVSDAALSPEAQAQECSYGQSKCNLYVLHQGEPVKLITELAARDNEAGVESDNNAGYVGDWQAGLGQKEAQATPDGHTQVFTSSQSLTGYNNKGSEEVYVYDFEGSKLFCASCNPTNEAPKREASAFLPVSYMNTYSHRWISADGKQVFFDSLDPLVPQDTNGLVDVYEWEQDGAGSCALSQGCIYLLSAGNSPESSFLADVSESGNDVFFTTRSQLVPEDTNENVDLYDARADAPQPVVAPRCMGTGCQGIPSAPPVFSTPSSVTYNGIGNFAAPVESSKAKAKPKPKKKKPKKSKKKGKKTKGKRKGASPKSKKTARKSVKSNGRSK